MISWGSSDSHPGVWGAKAHAFIHYPTLLPCGLLSGWGNSSLIFHLSLGTFLLRFLPSSSVLALDPLNCCSPLCDLRPHPLGFTVSQEVLQEKLYLLGWRKGYLHFNIMRRNYPKLLAFSVGFQSLFQASEKQFGAECFADPRKS